MQPNNNSINSDLKNLAKNIIHLYCDGACSGNPGPAGIGAVLIYNGNQKEISQYLGEGTNNIAELQAMLSGLEAITNRALVVKVYSDSSYVIGLLTKDWKAKANIALVAKLRDIVASFSQIEFIKVKGHANVKYNELADQLARRAVDENL